MWPHDLVEDIRDRATRQPNKYHAKSYSRKLKIHMSVSVLAIRLDELRRPIYHRYFF